MVLERWTNPRPLGTIQDGAAIQLFHRCKGGTHHDPLVARVRSVGARAQRCSALLDDLDQALDTGAALPAMSDFSAAGLGFNKTSQGPCFRF